MEEAHGTIIRIPGYLSGLVPVTIRRIIIPSILTFLILMDTGDLQDWN